jgi:hypothetical protein
VSMHSPLGGYVIKGAQCYKIVLGRKDMNKYPLIGGSICAVVVIILSSQTNVVGYQTHTHSSSISEKSITIAVIESKADGTSKKSTVTLSQDQYQKLKEDLNTIKDPIGRFTVFQKYGLIPKDMNAEKIRLGMEKRALQSGIIEEKQEIKQMVGEPSEFMCNVDVDGVPFFPLRKLMFTSIIYGLPIPSINLLIVYPSPVDSLNVNGHDYGLVMNAVVMFGFVGYTVKHVYPVSFESVGFCVLCLF